MPNIITFDADYVAELVAKMNTACSLMAEAVESLRTASLHRGWKCKECRTITENLEGLNKRLGRLDTGVNETTRVLSNSVAKYAELEARYRRQSESLSEDLRNNYGFQASGYTPSGGGGSGSGTVGGGSSSPSPSGGSSGGGSSTPSGTGSGSGTPTPDPEKTGQNPGTPTTTPSGGGSGKTGGGNVNVIKNLGKNTQKQDNTAPSGGVSGGGNGGGGGTVNLPVTHIPTWSEDTESLGIKSAREIEDIAVNSVADSIAGILGGNSDIVAMSPEQKAAAISNIVHVYSAGRSVVENSSVIIADPTQPHTEARIAMAAGLVNLAGTTAASRAAIGKTEISAAMNSGNSMTLKADELSQNAEQLYNEIKESPSKDVEEIKEVLESVSGKGGKSSQSTADKYLDKIKSTIMDKLKDGTSMLALGPLNINDFLSRIF